MISTAIWISSDEAKIYRFLPEQTEIAHIQRPLAKHNSVDDSQKLFQEASKCLLANSGDRLLILGPGVAKKHFKGFLERHHAPLSKRVIALKDTDHLTDGEMKDLAHRAFKQADAFEAI